MDDVAHDVKRGFLPWDELAVVPDVGGGLDGHGGVKLLLQLRSARIHKRIANLRCVSRNSGEGGAQVPECTPEIAAFDASLQLSDLRLGISGFGSLYPLKKLLDHCPAHASERLISH